MLNKSDDPYDPPLQARTLTNKVHLFAADKSAFCGRSPPERCGLTFDTDDRPIASPLCRELLSFWTRMTGLDGGNPSARSSPLISPPAELDCAHRCCCCQVPFSKGGQDTKSPGKRGPTCCTKTLECLEESYRPKELHAPSTKRSWRTHY